MTDRTKSPLAGLLLILALALCATPALADERYTFTLGLLGGLGGSLDADPGDELSNVGYQANVAFLTEPKTHLGLRLGRLDLEEADPFGSLTQADLTYATISGEYRFAQSFYESGIFVGLGGYQLEGLPLAGGQRDSETTYGVTLGLTGEFELTPHLGALIEVSGHWADFDEAQVFLFGHVGLAVHF
ncbi:MAG TPA: hypothetical protein VF017_08505 [Thermoanaerobaculia bacterium]|nr:hypothetical protein [Thermoanaerobaculia bacterium]